PARSSTRSTCQAGSAGCRTPMATSSCLRRSRWTPGLRAEPAPLRGVRGGAWPDCGHAICTLYPPSTMNTEPIAKPARSEARQARSRPQHAWPFAGPSRMEPRAPGTLCLRLAHPAEPLMQSRPFGRTGRNIGEIGFGAWAIGAAWGKVDDAESVAALHAALDA